MKFMGSNKTEVDSGMKKEVRRSEDRKLKRRRTAKTQPPLYRAKAVTHSFESGRVGCG